MKLISGSSNYPLSKKIASQLMIELVPVELTQFDNGEKRVLINQNLSGEEVVVVQSFSHPTDEHIIEFLLLCDSLKRLNARKVIAIIPWLGYSLQDKVFRTGEPVAVQVIAQLISSSFVHQVFLIDLHTQKILEYFTPPTEELSASSLFTSFVQENFKLDRAVVVSPDKGAMERSQRFADILNLKCLNIEKQRDRNSRDIIDVHLNGEISGQQALIFDDCILSGGTVMKVAELLKIKGATHVHYLATHGLFVNNALETLSLSSVDSLITTDSVVHNQPPAKIKELSVAPIIVQALKKL